MQKIELLAPAGNLQCLQAAVENGADAVYIGGPMFSARKNAENFTYEQMVEGVQYAHQRGKKVYVAVNTILSNQEFESLIPYGYQLLQAQVDAVIVQDLGVANLLRWAVPQLPLHASTQMVAHNTLGVKYLQNAGFRRVVLARETSLDDIKEILLQTEVEIETFVHGALCVAYSGQCFMSSMIGGRSGNRGLCAQPCRMAYQLVDEQGKGCAVDVEGAHLLSTKDLNMLEQIPRLIDAGIHSLKIEGRMKRAEYVATVVKYYRQAIDQYYGKTVLEQDAQKHLTQIFNREFTTGYYFHNPGKDLMSYVRPDNRGVFSGKVLSTKGKRVTVQLTEPLIVGDGYLLYNGKKEIAGNITELLLGGKKVEQASKKQIVDILLREDASGCHILYKTKDAKLNAQAKASYARPSSVIKKDIFFKLQAKLGHPLTLWAWDNENNHTYVQSEYIVELAKNHPSDYESIYKQMARLGNTEYQIQELVVEIDENVIAPASELNQLRRQAIEQLPQQGEKEQIPLMSEVEYEDMVGELLERIPPRMGGFSSKKLSVHVGNVQSLIEAVDNGADIVVMSATIFKKQAHFKWNQLGESISYCQNSNVQLVLALPAIQTNSQLAFCAAQLLEGKKMGLTGVCVGNVGSLQLAVDLQFDTIMMDYSFNIFNDPCIQAILENGISQVTLSPELSLAQIEQLSYIGNVPTEVIVHGNIPLMISEQCIVGSVLGKKNGKKICEAPCVHQNYSIKDRMNVQFPLRMDDHCRMYVYNSKTMSLYKRLGDILLTDIDIIRIEGKQETSQWVGLVTKIYRQGLDEFKKGKLIISQEHITQLESLSPQGSTYGHYFRGVQ